MVVLEAAIIVVTEVAILIVLELVMELAKQLASTLVQVHVEQPAQDLVVGHVMECLIKITEL